MIDSKKLSQIRDQGRSAAAIMHLADVSGDNIPIALSIPAHTSSAVAEACVVPTPES